MNVLVFNAGSSSLKFSLLEAEQERPLLDGAIDWSGEPARLMLRRPDRPDVTRDLHVRRHRDAIACLTEELRRLKSSGVKTVAATVGSSS